MENKFSIKFFQTLNGREPVKEYLDKLHLIDPEKCLSVVTAIKMLAKKGSMLGEPYVKKLQGEIWELRPKSERILYCCIRGNTIYLLHAFSKKSNKTPKKELKTAQQRYKLLMKKKD